MTHDNLVSIELRAGVCPFCSEKIAKSIDAGVEILGKPCTICDLKTFSGRALCIFGPENIFLVAKKKKSFFPFVHGKFVFSGTILLINQRIVQIRSVTGNYSSAFYVDNFEKVILKLGYYDLLGMMNGSSR